MLVLVIVIEREYFGTISLITASANLPHAEQAPQILSPTLCEH